MPAKKKSQFCFLLRLLDTTRVLIGQFSGAYSTVRPSGGSREGPPYFGSEKEIAEGRKAGRANKKEILPPNPPNPPPPPHPASVSSKSGCATAAHQNLKLFLSPKRLVIEGQVLTSNKCTNIYILTECKTCKSR